MEIKRNLLSATENRIIRIRSHQFRLAISCKLICIGLLFASILVGTGSPLLSNQDVFAQFDSDADGVDDSVDPCIDPNDLFNQCTSNSQQFSGGQQETGGGVSESGTGEEQQYGTSTGEEQQYGTSTGEEQQYGTSTGEEQQYGTSTGEEQASTSKEFAPTENTATGGPSENTGECKNFVELDCGAGTTDGGSGTATTATDGGVTETGGQDSGGSSFRDDDNDYVDDAYDPCIDPNDPLNSCSVTDRDHDGRPNEGDPCPDDELDLCPENGYISDPAERQAKEMVDSCSTSEGGIDLVCFTNILSTATGKTKEVLCAESAKYAVEKKMFSCTGGASTGSTDTGNKNLEIKGIGVGQGHETSYSVVPGSKESICASITQRENTGQNEFDQCMADWPYHQRVAPLTEDDMHIVCKKGGFSDGKYNLCKTRAGEVFWTDEFNVKTADFNIHEDSSKFNVMVDSGDVDRKWLPESVYQ